MSIGKLFASVSENVFVWLYYNLMHFRSNVTSSFSLAKVMDDHQFAIMFDNNPDNFISVAGKPAIIEISEHLKEITTLLEANNVSAKTIFFPDTLEVAMVIDNFTDSEYIMKFISYDITDIVKSVKSEFDGIRLISTIRSNKVKIIKSGDF